MIGGYNVLSSASPTGSKFEGPYLPLSMLATVKRQKTGYVIIINNALRSSELRADVTAYEVPSRFRN